MIKLIAQSPEKGHIVVLGLSRMNVERLVADDPILIQMEEVGLPKGEIIICFGETEADMNRKFREAGIVTDDTKLTLHPAWNKDSKGGGA